MTDGEGRDERGRFAPGNPGGPGGPRRRACELRRAAEEAVTPEHIQAVMRRALRMALEGNLQAMRFVLERAAGKPPESPTDPQGLSFTLPALNTPADCNAATQRIVEAICSGEIGREDAQLLLGAVQTRLKAIETVEFEERLRQLEEATPKNGRW